MADNGKPNPLGWSVNMLHLMLQATTILMEDIDQQLRYRGEKFRQDKKQYIRNYARCVEHATYWMEKFGLDVSCWEAVGENGKAYSNVIADANELIRVVMLYMDRAHTYEGYQKVMRFLRSIPENGIFPEKYIARYDMKHEWLYGKGDKVDTPYGQGVVDFHANGDDWCIKFPDGTQKIVNESKLKLL